jgi:chromosome segregation ATPase
MDPYTEIKKAEDHLREIYNTNDGPRLIAEMVEREFPEAYGGDLVAELKEELKTARGEIKDLRQELDDAEREINNLRLNG